MSDNQKTGFVDSDGDAIEGFTCTCDKCGNSNVSIEDNVRMGSTWTGVYGSVDLVCRDCGYETEIKWA